MKRVTRLENAKRTCPNCGAEMGEVMEIEHNGETCLVLQLGNQFILDERALCSKCWTPIYWETSLKQLQKVAQSITDAEILTNKAGG